MKPGFAHYADLVLFKAFAELKTESTRTFIGVAWWVLDPILYMAVFYFVFGVMFDRGGENFVAFLLIGLVFFRWFGNSVSNGALSIRSGHTLMQQVYLPKIVFPLVTYVSDGFKFVCTLSLLLVFLWASGFSPTVHYWALPGVLAVQLVFNLGCLLIVAAIVPVVPDIKFLVTHGVTILLFSSGVFYEVSDLPEHLQKILYLNPLTGFLEAYRHILLHQSWPRLDQLLPGAIWGIVLLGVGLLIVTRLDRKYPKIVRMRGF